MNKIVKFAAINKRISSYGGNFLVKELNQLISLERLISPSLPKNVRNTSFDKFMGLFYGFVTGAECLDDMGKLSKDRVFDNIVKTFDPVSYGRFLRDFTKENTNELRQSLLKHAIKLRQKSFGIGDKIVLDIDSSKHRQYGLKMEGVKYDGYSKQTCLDTLCIFDKHGFLYWFDVRPGDTHTAKNSDAAITEVINAIRAVNPKTKIKIIVRADRGYTSNQLYNTCFVNKLKFVSGLRSTVYNPHRKKVTNWKKVRKTKHKIYFSDGREAELGSTLYFPDKAPEPLRIVFMRALKKDVDQYHMLEEDWYDYQCFITNISSKIWRDDQVINFYKRRGNAENYIKELKNAYDLHHFPCHKLNANKVYGLIAGFAHNTMRFLGTLIDKKHIPYAKRIRFLLIYLPCQVVKHARSTIAKYENHILREVMRIRQKIYKSFQLIFEN